VDELRDALDHPVFFLLVLTIGVICMTKIFGWGLKAAGYSGPASLTE
jgi:hypothetical protein